MTNRKRTATAEAGPENIHAALIARLSRIEKSTARAKAHQSLQPKPDAANGRLGRIRRKQRMLSQESTAASLNQLSATPAAPDPLLPLFFWGRFGNSVRAS